ncbi:hypothetical protein I7I50_09430 [Histoplasma capsulatum G186AR]|uniref:Uncharacterized protein n=1 Tax=Ajellomyces capsulatus TaxID=5037 RepID=A0A8H7YU67_AJECA|nr:hypothetical protein I7I52_06951 [Histoplasma capsulatum]QSS74315.1 hypothetical protein I7I50_09430 [Histoplasma capsulatum G186AR]
MNLKSLMANQLVALTKGILPLNPLSYFLEVREWDKALVSAMAATYCQMDQRVNSEESVQQNIPHLPQNGIVNPTAGRLQMQQPIRFYITLSETFSLNVQCPGRIGTVFCQLQLGENTA